MLNLFLLEFWVSWVSEWVLSLTKRIRILRWIWRSRLRWWGRWLDDDAMKKLTASDIALDSQSKHCSTPDHRHRFETSTFFSWWSKTWILSSMKKLEICRWVDEFKHSFKNCFVAHHLIHWSQVASSSKLIIDLQMQIYIEEHSQIFLKVDFETWRLALFTFSKSRVLSIPTSTFEVRDEMHDHLSKRSQLQDDWRQKTTHGSFKLLRIL